MNKNQKIFFTPLLILFVLLTFLAPYAVRAQGGPLDPAIEANTRATAVQAAKIAAAKAREEARIQAEKRAAQVRASISYNLIANGLIPAASMFFNRLAYKFATDLATAGKGGEPLIFTQSWKDYLEYAGGAALGEFLGQLSNQPWNTIGFDFCNPNIKVNLILQLAFWHEQEPEPKCQWSTISANYGAVYDKFRNDPGKALLSLTGFQFKRGQSELGIALSSHDTLYKRVWQNDREANAKRQEGNGFKPILGGIADNVRTPASVFENELNEQSRTKHKASEIKIGAFLTNSDLYGQFGAVAGAVFVNTLAEKLLKRFFDGLLPDIPVPPPNIPRPSLLASSDDQGGAGLISAPEVYGELLTVQFAPPTNYNPVNEFVACASGIRGANHCAMDQQFAAAVSSAASGEPLTVRQAIGRGYIFPYRLLISAQDPRNKDTLFCTTQGYCESNLKKLRLARIIPVGWEMAAARSPVGEGAVTLGTAINNFSNCNTGGDLDDAHPYCHLIDPNWVIKLPQTQCRLKLSGATRVSADGPSRELLCVDAQTCIEENEKGECIGGYGYCEREKTVWRLGGDHCPAHAASCLALNTRTGSAVNYLLDSVDVGVCNETNVGCTGYSTIPNPTTGWDRNPALFLDKDAVACEEAGAGCTELVKRSGGVPRNLIANGSFEEDADDNNFPDGWNNSPTRTFYLTNSTDALAGTAAMRINTGILDGFLNKTGGIDFLPATTYTISVYAKLAPGATLPADAARYPFIGLSFQAVTDLRTEPTTCTFFGAVGNIPTAPLAAGSDYERFSCNFKMPAGDRPIVGVLTIYVPYSPELGKNGIIVDAVQVEEGATPTPYNDGGRYGDVSLAYLKIAPRYLECTGEAGESEECRNYARFCRVDEVGCELYTPKNGDPGIPGIIGSGDRCPQECVGYDTFKQEATVLDPRERFPLFFIPSTARACSAAVVGCDEFTNLDTASVGREAREYFTNLRVCQKPGSDTRTYYTWEGSDTVGYQLRTWSLKKSNRNDGPCTRLNSSNPALCDDVADNDANPMDLPAGSPGGCTAAEVTTNPDCREFYDASENIYRRLYTRTIVSTADCHPYRKTDSTSDACSATNGAWNSTAGTCIYNVYPGESGQCAAAQNGCRAFTGDTGRNTFEVLNTTFESGTAEGWINGMPSSESITVSGHSLLDDTPLGALSYVFGASSSPRIGGTYTLEFWAKGRDLGADGVNVRFDPMGVFAGLGSPPVHLTTEWQRYSLGPVQVTNVSQTAETLRFSGYERIYIDNVILREVDEGVYIIKDSWNTPLSCDQTLDGAPLPQAMLGCEEYQDRASAAHYLKSFTQLCREESVGCEGFINTYNSEALTAETYNVHCQTSSTCINPGGCPCGGGGAGGCTIPYRSQFCTYKASNSGPSDACIAGVSDTACRAADTTTIPADDNINVVNDSTFACDTASKGCSALGEHQINQVCTLADDCNILTGCSCEADNHPACAVPFRERSCDYKNPPGGSVATKYLLNQPDTYGETFCSVAAEGCESYSHRPTGQTYYFKKPEEKLCDFRENVTLSPGTPPVTGWFKKGTTDSCGYIDLTPEDDDDTRSPYIIAGGRYGLWRNADTNYEGFVGECQLQQSGCTEFVDAYDTSSHPSGRPYYYLRNNKISAGDCNGQANPREGCILLRDTSNPVLTYNTDLTYAASANLGDIKVVPTDCRNNIGTCGASYRNDANTIVKVISDRACTEWLACRTSVSVYDPNIGGAREVCTQYGRCLEYAEGGGGATCVRFASNIGTANLTPQHYSDRNVTLRGSDYSGYSIPGLRPIPAMTISSSGRLSIGTRLDGAGGTETVREDLSCRGFPEENSPFPTEIAQFGADKVISYEQNWENVNVCQPDQPEDCQCSYSKLTWGSSLVKYRDFYPPEIEPGICEGGPRDGQSCIPGIVQRQSNSLSCGPSEDAGACVPLSRVDRFLGFRGFCLERDLSLKINGSQNNDYNCITWYPSGDILSWSSINRPNSDEEDKYIDSFNYFESAGFSSPYPTFGGRFYCAQVEGNYRTDEPHYFEPEICKTIVDVRGGPRNRIYARTDRLMSKAPLDPLNTSGQLNYQYLHDVPPMGSALLRETNPGQTSRIPWVSYSPNVCKFLPGSNARIRQFCTLKADGPCDGGTRSTEWCDVQIIWQTEGFESGEIFCEEDRCECDVGTLGIGGLNNDLLNFNCTIRRGASSCIFTGGDGTDYTCTLGASYKYDDSYEPYECGNPFSGSTQAFFYDGGTCKEGGNGCKITSKDDLTCTETNGCFCGLPLEESLDQSTHETYLGCTIQHGSALCKYEEQLLYGGVPWSCEGACGTVLGSDGNIKTFDFDPNTESPPTATGDLSFTGLYTPTDAFNLNSGVERLQQLFGRVRKVFTWDNNSLRYVLSGSVDCTTGTTPTGCWNQVTGNADRSLQAMPQLSAIKPDGTMVRPDMAPLAQGQNSITVNGRWDAGSEVGGRGSVGADLQFAFWTEPHGPITDINIEWGDGSKFHTMRSKYKNRVPGCGGAFNDGQFFLSPAACEDRPAQFKHTYVYKSTCAGHHSNEAHLDLGIPLGVNHCHFKPKVTIKDNWGYCNGICPGGPDGSNACFDANYSGLGTSEDECNDDDAGTSFAGEVIVGAP